MNNQAFRDVLSAMFRWIEYGRDQERVVEPLDYKEREDNLVNYPLKANIRKGKVLVMSVMTAWLVPSISALVMRIAMGGGRIPLKLAGVAIVSALFVLLYRGHNWARWILAGIAMLGNAVLVAIAGWTYVLWLDGLMPLAVLAVAILAVAINVFCAAVLIGSGNVKAFLQYQQCSRRNSAMNTARFHPQQS